jgi:uncharacterized membrane protein
MSDPTVPPPSPYNAPPPPPSGPVSGAVSPNRGIMIVLSYLWLLALVPLLVEKQDAEVQWHAKNGLMLLAAEVVIWIAFGAVHFILAMIHLGIIGCFLGLLGPLIGLGFLVVRIICILKGVKGERFIIPVVSQYASQINI